MKDLSVKWNNSIKILKVTASKNKAAQNCINTKQSILVHQNNI